jgi:hypothetical protein
MYGICVLSRWIGYNIVARCKERGVSSKGYSSKRMASMGPLFLVLKIGYKCRIVTTHHCPIQPKYQGIVF